MVWPGRAGPGRTRLGRYPGTCGYQSRSPGAGACSPSLPLQPPHSSQPPPLSLSHCPNRPLSRWAGSGGYLSRSPGAGARRPRGPACRTPPPRRSCCTCRAARPSHTDVRVISALVIFSESRVISELRAVSGSLPALLHLPDRPSEPHARPSHFRVMPESPPSEPGPLVLAERDSGGGGGGGGRARGSCSPRGARRRGCRRCPPAPPRSAPPPQQQPQHGTA